MKPKVAIISFPWASNGPYKLISEVLKIIEPISDKIVLINGNTKRINFNSENFEIRDIGISMHYVNEVKPTSYSFISWIFKCGLAQIKIGFELIKMKNIDVVIFYLAYPYYLLPLIISKSLGNTNIEIITRGKSNSNSFLSRILKAQDKILFELLDGFSPESKALTLELGINKYGKKVLEDGYRFVDTSKYNIQKSISCRKKVIGFIGRLKKEKGIVEFMRAIPLISEVIPDAEFLIGGDGDLKEWTIEEITRLNQTKNVKIKYVGWISDDLQIFLNELKILVIPSYSEGFPTIILEAMACGTPVLTTSVGGIVDIITDSKTGFILEKNSPDCIARCVINILTKAKIEYIIKNAQTLIFEKYTYENALYRWEMILKSAN